MADIFGLIMAVLEGLWPAIRLAAPGIVLLAAADGLRRSGMDSIETVTQGINDGIGRMTGSAARHLIYGSVLGGMLAAATGRTIIAAVIITAICLHGLWRMDADPIEHQLLHYSAVATVPVAIVAAVTSDPILQALCVIELYGTVFWRI